MYEITCHGWEDELIFTILYGLFAKSSKAKSPTLTTSRLPLIILFMCASWLLIEIEATNIMSKKSTHLDSQPSYAMRLTHFHQ